MTDDERPPSFFTPEYATVQSVAGPLLFLDRVHGAGYHDVVEVITPDGATRRGRILELDRERAVVEVFTGTRGLDVRRTRVRLTGSRLQLGVSTDLLGRVFDGAGTPIDGGPPIMPEELLDVNGAPANPAVREPPAEFIETGLSCIDGLNTLARGQKLPIFSGFGLPAGELAARLATHSRVVGEQAHDFVVILATMGITRREAAFFRRVLERSGKLWRSILFLNLADDPSIERLLTPRLALTAAEHLAFTHGFHVLVILTDMTSYCEALREVAAAREEVPGRRGYPGYMYTDLAAIFERAGRYRERQGSITQIPILSMPDDDITHPIPDLTGYVTEGQIVLSRELHRRNVDPPVDVLPSLSRLMNAGIGEGRTRPDHRQVADQIYAFYARGRDLRRLVTIVGEESLAEEDRRHLALADAVEARFVGQQAVRRTIEQTLDLAWELLSPYEADRLRRIDPSHIERFHRAPGRAPEPPAASGAG